MSTFEWWHLLFNLNFIAFVVIVAAVIYCVWTGHGLVRKKKYPFVGIGNTGFDLGEFKGVLPRRRRRGRKKNKHEERCRQIFEDIFNRRFKTIRPDWLKNPATGKNLELDGYCSLIRTRLGKGLAFEYDGVQHSRYNKHFHRNGPDEFVYQTKKDSWKDIRCKEEGVLLIRIPHFVAYEDLERYIKNKLRQVGLRVRVTPKQSIIQERPRGFLNGLYR